MGSFGPSWERPREIAGDKIRWHSIVPPKRRGSAHYGIRQILRPVAPLAAEEEAEHPVTANRRHIELAEIDERFTGTHSLIFAGKNFHSRHDRKVEHGIDFGIERFLDQSSSAIRPRLKTRTGDGTTTDSGETRSLRQFSRRNVGLRLKQMLEVGITRREPGCSFRGRENKTLRIIEWIS